MEIVLLVKPLKGRLFGYIITIQNALYGLYRHFELRGAAANRSGRFKRTRSVCKLRRRRGAAKLRQEIFNKYCKSD